MQKKMMTLLHVLTSTRRASLSQQRRWRYLSFLLMICPVVKDFQADALFVLVMVHNIGLLYQSILVNKLKCRYVVSR